MNGVSVIMKLDVAVDTMRETVRHSNDDTDLTSASTFYEVSNVHEITSKHSRWMRGSQVSFESTKWMSADQVPLAITTAILLCK